MKKRVIYGAGVVLLLFLLTLVVWQGSFKVGDFGPSSPEQTYLFWALSTIVFLLTITLGFILFRTALKLYIERQSNRVGSRIRSKLVGGALALSFVPVTFLVIWSISVLNNTLEKWFSRPGEGIRINLIEIGQSIEREARAKAAAQARWLVLDERTLAAIRGAEKLDVCNTQGIAEVWYTPAGGERKVLCSDSKSSTGTWITETKLVPGLDGEIGVRASLPIDLIRKQQEITRYVHEYDQLGQNKKETRRIYILLLLLITMFILFVATWLAQFMAKQISSPIAALLEGADQVRNGNLAYRVRATAVDELALLVRAFNEMTAGLETGARELERRRRLTEAILESIPTGVVSCTSDGRIQKTNRAMKLIFTEEQMARAARLDDLFSKEDAAEIRYLMKRARRTGVATRQLELRTERQTLHLAVTAAAVEENITSGFVLVIEDTSELLRAQRATAWNEVARRIAHEIKNPLTPIALSAERIQRQLARLGGAENARRIVDECSAIILREVQSVKTLVDEFSQFARFPAAQPAPADLNEIVRNALAVFDGRLDGIVVRTDLAADLPPVLVDREQIKRVVVNLVDNAAEAMLDSPLRLLLLATQATSGDTVELIVADTGCGVSADDREKLFLPYFSTKGRGTGLGLAIVNHILAEHSASIRVEDNQPAGARFTIEFATAQAAEAEGKQAEAKV